MKKFIVPLTMAFALAGFAPAFAADTGTDPSTKTETTPPSDTTATAPKSDKDKKKDEKSSTGTPPATTAPDAPK